MDVNMTGGSYLTPALEHASAGDAMRPRVLTCTADTPLFVAAQRMSGEHVHALVVLRADSPSGDDGRPWTVLTDRDLLHHASEASILTSGEAASGPVVTARPGDRLVELAERMVRDHASHAVVVDPVDDRPIGIVSTLDIAGIIAWGRG
jgi:CBS domain-containing protein